jgi:CO/xanthine dehydrogenase Mo-binding subunit
VIEFLQAENHFLKERLRGKRIRFTDAERALLARKAKAVGRKALLELDTVVSCLTEGARRFGWDKRKPEPHSMRDGRYLVGQGVAAAIYTHWRWPAKARVTLRRDGSALVESGMHEIGGGTYTVMRQGRGCTGAATGQGRC